MAFLQVFATLSPVVLSIAGYLGRVKRGAWIYQSLNGRQLAHRRLVLTDGLRTAQAGFC